MENCEKRAATPASAQDRPDRSSKAIGQTNCRYLLNRFQRPFLRWTLLVHMQEPALLKLQKECKCVREMELLIFLVPPPPKKKEGPRKRETKYGMHFRSAVRYGVSQLSLFKSSRIALTCDGSAERESVSSSFFLCFFVFQGSPEPIDHRKQQQWLTGTTFCHMRSLYWLRCSHEIRPHGTKGTSVALAPLSERRDFFCTCVSCLMKPRAPFYACALTTVVSSFLAKRNSRQTGTARVHTVQIRGASEPRLC